MDQTLNTVNPKAAEEPTMLTPEAIVEQLRALRKQIPEFTQLPVSDLKGMARVARVNVQFADMAINSVGESPLLETAIGRSSASLREELEEAGRWTAVEDELTVMLKGVTAANLLRRHRLGTAALAAYNLSLRLSQQKEHEHLLPRVREMKRIPKFGTKRKPEPPPDETIPAPHPTTTEKH